MHLLVLAVSDRRRLDDCPRRYRAALCYLLLGIHDNQGCASRWGYFWSIPSTYASLLGGLACFIFLLIAAAMGDDRTNHQLHVGPTIVALLCYCALMLWAVWRNSKRTGSALLGISLSFVQSLALIAAVGAILSWLNASGTRRYEKDHGNAT